jgi:hypothetical protein
LLEAAAPKTDQPNPTQYLLTISPDHCTMEDYNEPSEERVGLLKRLEDAMRPKDVEGREAEEREEGTVPPHFWAACQICDIKALDKFVDFTCEPPTKARILAAQTRPMIQFCKYNILKFPIFSM